MFNREFYTFMGFTYSTLHFFSMIPSRSTFTTSCKIITIRSNRIKITNFFYLNSISLITSFASVKNRHLPIIILTKSISYCTLILYSQMTSKHRSFKIISLTYITLITLRKNKFYRYRFSSYTLKPNTHFLQRYLDHSFRMLLTSFHVF